jgi:hypothetical protein
MIRPALEPSPDASLSLVPDSGLQFLDLGFALDKLRLSRAWHEEPRAQGLVALRALTPNTEGEGYFYQRDGRRIDVGGDDAYTIDARNALAPFLNKWIPLAFLQVEVEGAPGERRLARGPSNWARLRIVELAEKDPRSGHTHRAVLAFDTRTAKQTTGAAFVSPWEDEAAKFELATRIDENSWFLELPWIEGWLAEIWREHIAPPARAGAAPAADAAEAQLGCRHFAQYLTLLAALEEMDAVPAVRMIDIAAARRHNEFIDVDLVLDVGNSRSYGLLIEQTPDRQAGLRDSYVLELRDLSRPEEIYAFPFESQVEFARVNFGKDDWSLQSGRADAFAWNSPVRIGPEAARLAGANRGNEGVTGLSSPKRYLWDESPRAQPWRNNPLTDSAGGIRGEFLRYVTQEGKVIARSRGGIALRPLFSRASLFTFLLAEVLLHARSQINSAGVRLGRQYRDVPRRLNRLILTLPPATPVAEQERLRARAIDATFLYADLTGARDQKRIAVSAQLDEASATQIVYLYDQIAQQYRGDIAGYFRLKGRVRPSLDAKPSLRIASIDIGGGTTDLSIITYTLVERVITPREDFREGFKLAGDDVLEMVVMRHVIPAVVRRLTQCGLDRGAAERLLLGLYRSAGGTEPERQGRRQTLLQIFVPVALGILQHYERWDPLSPESVETVPMGELIRRARHDSGGLKAKYPEPRGAPRAAASAMPPAAQWLQLKATEAGVSGFDLAELPVDIDPAAVHDTVIQTLRDALDALCEIIHRHGCDVLLLTGRVSRFPAVAQAITGALAVDPNRVQPMHVYRVGSWYPYTDSLGRIHDPKTTAAVGAMLCHLLEGRLPDLTLLASKIRMRSTARYVGLMESDGRVRGEKILFAGLDLDSAAAADQPAERPLALSGPCFLGFKQFKAERWPATPLYRLALRNPQSVRNYAMPLQVMLQRPAPAGEQSDSAPEQFAIDQVLAADGSAIQASDVMMRLQTLKDEDGYWLDTGRLDTLDSILAAVKI